MKNIEEYIDLLKAEKAKAEKSAQLFIDCGDNDYTDYHRGLVEAFALALSKAELLLNPKLNNAILPQLNKHDVLSSADVHKLGEAILKKQFEIYSPIRKAVVEVPEIVYQFDKAGIDIVPKVDF